MGYGRGEVWWGPALHKGTSAYRPWVIVSDDSHPFPTEECIALAMTTKRHREGIPVPDRAWAEGGSKRDASISPWYVTTVKLDDLDRQQGVLDEGIVDEAVAALHEYTGNRQ